MRDFSFLLLFLLGPAICLSEETRHPNVVIIVADDLGYADMGFLPNCPDDVTSLGTPGIDRLASLGAYFEEAYATAPICSPARCGLITGRYQQRWGNYWYGQGGLPSEETTLAHVLKDVGYRTVKIGKTHLNGGAAEHPLDHGFDEFLGFRHHTWDYMRLSEKDLQAYKDRADGKPLGILCVGPLERDREEPVSLEDEFTTDVFTRRAIEVIEDEQDARPYYIQLEYNAVHMPTYVAHPDWAKRVGFEQPEWNRDDPDSWKFPYWDPQKEAWAAWHKQWGHLEAIDPLGRKRYLSHLIAMDDGISRIISSVESTGQLDNTILVFLSDNGGTINTYSNNGSLRGWKYMFGEGGIRIPMIVAWPGRLPQGIQPSGVVSAMDVFPTIAELAGVEMPEDLDGRSLLPIIRGEQSGDNHELLCWSDGKGAKVIRRGPWKLAIDAGWMHQSYKLVDGLAVRDEPVDYPDGVALFNLHDDPSETTNIAEKYPEVVRELADGYERWRSHMGKPVSGKVKK